MLSTYAPAIVFVLLGTVIGVAFSWLNYVLGPRRAIDHKLDPYESGMPSEIKQGFRFGISFYLVAMLFLLFDIEVLFLYPIAVQLRAFGTFALGVALWLVYGLELHAVPIIVANVVTLGLALVILVLKWWYRSGGGHDALPPARDRAH